MRALETISAATLCALFSLSGCTPVEPPVISPRRTQLRPIEALPDEVAADIITVRQFRRVSDMLARSLVVQPFITRSPRPPVITIRKLENKTGIEIDGQIFQETIRVKLIEHAKGGVLFRDDVSYKDIIQERARQSGNQVTVTLTDSVVETKGYKRAQEREFESGLLSGSSKKATEQTSNVKEESKTETSQSATVRSQIAGADYFLRGIIYQIIERDVNNPRRGMNYFQYQFRVVDARSGLIVWEKMLDSKMEGIYPARVKKPEPVKPQRQIIIIEPQKQITLPPP